MSYDIAILYFKLKYLYQVLVYNKKYLS